VYKAHVPVHEAVWHSRDVHSNADIAEILEVLNTRTPIDERERESIEKFLADVPHLAEPYDEELGLVHVTASAIVVTDAGDKVALHLHKRLGMWLQPGGHIDAGETPAQGALREAEEETGLPVRHEVDGGLFVHVDVHAGPKGHTHHDLRYVIRAPEVPMNPGDGESPDARWFTWDEALEIADVGLFGGLLATKALLGL
jgi:8-oxo-dGTP pyrophosphatase MutT (NUDIX family)